MIPIPDRISRLLELAHNLWWSWHPEARDLFQTLDNPLWKSSGHNPVKQLQEMSPERLRQAAADPVFLRLHDSVLTAFDADTKGDDTWFHKTNSGLLRGPIAYFSMEFAIHNSLPIYAGGLGILAGDICKEASDLGLPLVGVGFMYPQGYFHQRITPDGWQKELYEQLNFDETPIEQLFLPGRNKLMVEVPVGDKRLYVSAWRVRIGRVNLYLLDTNVEENSLQDRLLSSRLYVADQETRLQQEIVLGVAGVKVLRALGINPEVWHANEGHPGFMMLERIREKLETGTPMAEAIGSVQANTVFTTHTPVPAGHDIFPAELVEKYFAASWQQLGIDRDQFLQLGRRDGKLDPTFNMTILALKMSNRRNGVSRLHGMVSRRMWHVLWPEASEESVPISHITNGIHLCTWVAPEMATLFKKYLGPEWLQKQDEEEIWAHVNEMPDEELWEVRNLLKHKLMAVIFNRFQRGWANGEMTADQVIATGALFHPDYLTLGFVRRFVEYKRPGLIFRDIQRLKRIITDPSRPVQIVFAGKSHPADTPAKHLLHQVYQLAGSRDFHGRIIFIEDYDMHMSRYLVSGVDVWLNTPRRLWEASGTSGMKASINGVPHLSVRDGWWHEGYKNTNGWAIGGDLEDRALEDEADSRALYRLLEEEIVPCFYDRDRAGVPHRWVQIVKEAIRTVAPLFCTRRMMKEYTNDMYMPAAASPRESIHVD
ncbi:MAG: alpha-glucan family phosphorylase [Dehalococcoidia bacterium]|nr:alpha-glucan family phosphorylase [Dehalococcoidia bacterium]